MNHKRSSYSFRWSPSDLLFSLGLIFFTPVMVSMSLAEEPSTTNSTHLHVYVGSYAEVKDVGISHWDLDLTTGKLTKIDSISGIRNPSFLAIHPNKKSLYAVSEIGDYQGKKAGAVFAYKIIPKSGSLNYAGEVTSKGGAPCHLVVDCRWQVSVDSELHWWKCDRSSHSILFTFG